MVPQPDQSEFSRSTEDYLKAIYKIGSHGQPAQTNAIAEELNVAPPSVSGMMKRLFEAGLIEYEPYRGAQLTDTGRTVALNMLRRHRILETYLTQKLGFSWDTVHEEAERLEHAASDVLIERMAISLGNPRFDPHGDPIPTETGEIETPLTIALTDVPAGKRVALIVVGDQDPERLRFIESLGLKPGVVFEVKEHQPFRGPVRIRIHGQGEDRIVGHEVAISLQCARVEEEHE